MHALTKVNSSSKRDAYGQLVPMAQALLAGEHDRVANAANLCALMFQTLADLNWVGIYFFNGHELVVGPFQGKPACVRIALGKGVCGTAAATRTTQVVRDVHAFPGHIACDAASNSEIVIPIVAEDGRLIGVWDVDSPVQSRFDDDDRAGMEALVQVYLRSLTPAQPTAQGAAGIASP